jgi:uncharacterized protein YqcC (DUF446 family)
MPMKLHKVLKDYIKVAIGMETSEVTQEWLDWILIPSRIEILLTSQAHR